jgi:PAS domain S-box-containing protein
MIEKNGCVKISTKKVLKTEETLELQKFRESEGMFKSILDNIQDAYIRADIDGNIILVSPSASRMYRFDSPQEMTGLSALSLYKYVKDRNSLIEKLNKDGKAEDYESTALRKDGTTFLVSLNSQYYYNDKGQIQGTEAFVRDITERKNLEFENEISKGFLELVNKSNNVSELIHSALNFFRQKSGCEAVGIRLKKGEDYPYYETQGFPEYFIKLENNLCSYNECGKPEVDNKGYPIMECMCGNVICDRFDPSQPFFTNNGSFWTNNTTKLLASSSEDDRQARTRNRCNGEGYESVALIPLISGGKKLGLLQLNDTRKNLFSPELITVWERLTGYLSIALMKFQTDEHRQQLLENEQQLTEELQTSNEELQSTTEELHVTNEELTHHGQELLKINIALEESEERFRSIVENIQDAYMRADNDGNIIFASPSAARMYGYDSPEDMIGISDLSYYKNPEDRKYVLQKLMLDDKIENNEIQALRRDGTCFYASQNVQYHFDKEGQILGTETLVRNITQIKSIEEKLKENESNLKISKAIADERNRLFDVLETLPIMICLLTPDYHVAFANRSFREKFGESNGRHCYDYCFGFSEPCEFCESYKVLETGKPHQWSVNGTDGSIIEAYDFPFTDIDGSPLILEMDMDVTEQRHTQDDLNNLNKTLEEKVKERTKDLEQSNKELEQFAYITSHDLREPLRMITSFLQLLEKRYNDQLDKDAHEFIGFAVDGAKRLDAMTNDLLQYSKITNKKRETIPVNFEHVLEHALTNLKVQIEENNAIITHDPLPRIVGDEELKVQLFQNIIGNAIKYRSNETPKIHISATKEKNQYLFSIKDNGIGMSPKHLEKIFTIFQRLHTHEEYEGTGIGLAIAQKIVNQPGGEIWAESDVGKGSTFYFTIPINLKFENSGEN